MRLVLVPLFFLPLVVTGCSLTLTADPVPAQGRALIGSLHGGQQPIIGSHVYLFAADYACPSSSSLVYLAATGGNPGFATAVNNSSIALMAALGPCNTPSGSTYTLDPSSFITVNEVTTIAAIYALAPFMSSISQVATSSTNTLGLQHAFTTAANLADTDTGAARTATHSGSGLVPQNQINSLANILATCVNTNGTDGGCSTLFTDTTPSGGSIPTDTVAAMLQIALHPALKAGALYALQPISPAFLPKLSVIPQDWSLGISYSGGNMGGVNHLAIDSGGNVWVTNSDNVNNCGADCSSYRVIELGSDGTFLSGGGYTGGGLDVPAGIAFDQNGSVWVGGGAGTISEFTAQGHPTLELTDPNVIESTYQLAVDSANQVFAASGSNLVSIVNGSPSLFYTRPSSFQPEDVAFDSKNQLWMRDGTSKGVWKFSDTTVSPSTLLSPVGGYIADPSSAGTPNYIPGIVIDHQNAVWVENFSTLNGKPNISKFDNNGNALSPAGGFTFGTTNITPNGLAVDGSGNIWIYTNAGIGELDNSGNVISPTYGFTGSTVGPLDCGSGSCYFGTGTPYPFEGNAIGAGGIAVDGSGNVWLLMRGFLNNGSSGAITELVGIATPVVTPIAAGVVNNTLGTRP